jgi:hypothetical protein
MGQYKSIKSLTELKRGSIVRHKSVGESFMVDTNYGDRATAVAFKDITNPAEWIFKL